MIKTATNVYMYMCTQYINHNTILKRRNDRDRRAASKFTQMSFAAYLGKHKVGNCN